LDITRHHWISVDNDNSSRIAEL